MPRRHTGGRLRPAAAVCAALAFLSCNMDYGKDLEVKTMARDVPDIVVLNAQARIVRDDVLIMTMDAERLETYGEAGNQVLVGVKFSQFDREGKVTARGTAGKAVRAIQTDDVQFSGGLAVEVVSEKAHITSDSLDWTAADKVLRSKPDAAVQIAKDDGSRFTGHGLFADLPGRTIELGGGVEGVINNE